MITEEDKRLIKNGITLEQKFAKVLRVIKWVRPFYSSIYEVMNKIETKEIPTMAVDASKFYYNSKFSDEIPFSEFTFVILHEIAHIALFHAIRRKDRDSRLWNIACDLYVNKLLDDEFRFQGGSKAGVRDSNTSLNITMPDDCVYFKEIDIDKDSVDSLYEELYLEGLKNGYFASVSASEVEKNGALEKTFDFHIVRKTTYTYTLDLKYVFDLMDVGKGEDSLQSEADAHSLISEACIRNELCNRNQGSTPGQLERLCKEMMESKLNWKKILKKQLIEYQQSDISFSRPDKRMYWQEAIYPGKSFDESKNIKNVKICIDTSGSISDNELAEFFGHIKKLFKQFKVEAEVIYWDSAVASKGKISAMKELERVSIYGGGGTDPSCAFKYIDGEKNGAITVLMFTDGYFNFNEKSIAGTNWAKKYKNTIWIICKNGDKNMKVPFGKVTYYSDAM